MRPYLSGSPVGPVATARGEHRIPDDPHVYERSALNGRPRAGLAAHVRGVDGWCAGCLAHEIFLLWPCPVVSTRQPVPDEVARTAGGARQ